MTHNTGESNFNLKHKQCIRNLVDNINLVHPSNKILSSLNLETFLYINFNPRSLTYKILGDHLKIKTNIYIKQVP